MPFIDEAVITVKAGDGGNGGAGQGGQTAGGISGIPSAGGCLGGKGGVGGKGGAGAGGVGGVSVGVVYRLVAPSLDGTTITTGLAGKKGTGGAQNDGLEGQSVKQLELK